MAELTEKQKSCRHSFGLRYVDNISTGKRVLECWKCGTWKDGRAYEGTMAWKAQRMMEETGAKSVTLGDAVKWYDQNFPGDKYATQSI